ncbi:hypothetical protein PILCRDRAFT_192655 [Piloderma croceum F 1598]|uniref:Uncharacterized protein n=1 Tax=Piloderma croceum (strain F 1598) TaxID=765440 RepID=A0A0C3GGB4_PILCF|nr:hypothetical protein PILCRDRAFT_192655 [Piloderma croceum F 1598]
MRRCCAERRPFVLYKEEVRYLFVEEGVFQAPSTFLSSEYRGFVWTLVDADEAQNGVPERLVPSNTGHFVIYSTSPDCSRWSCVHKTIRERVIVMDPWTWKREIKRAAPLRLDEPDFDRINDIFYEFGPIPRLCIEYNKEELSRYKVKLTDALSDLTISKLTGLIEGGIGLSMNAVSHKLCLVEPD